MTETRGKGTVLMGEDIKKVLDLSAHGMKTPDIIRYVPLAESTVNRIVRIATAIEENNTDYLKKCLNNQQLSCTQISRIAEAAGKSINLTALMEKPAEKTLWDYSAPTKETDTKIIDMLDAIIQQLAHQNDAIDELIELLMQKGEQA